ncbi:MAG TPA: tripartite tricarboxylate transporter substrate binding protein, partial [Burkholderiales bacterium]
PSRPLKMIVPFPPAGATDIVGRIVAQKLSERLGQPVVVENRPGAGGSLGSDLAAKSAPDGYTILMATSSTHSIGPVLQKLPYDPIKDFAPITHVANVPNVLVVSPKLPVNNLSDLVKLARSQPGKLNYASAGVGSITQLNVEKLKLIAKLDIVHVPYKGTQLSIPDLASGNVALLFDSLASALPNIKSGNARPIALNAPKRSALLPEVPTLAEAGMPEFDLYTWFGMFAPAGTPADVVARLQREVAAGLKAPDVLERYAAVGAEPVGSTPAEFVARIKGDAASWAEVIRAGNIKAQ